MSSSSSKLTSNNSVHTPTSTGWQKLSSTMLKSNRDVPPASQGRYATPVLTQCDDDLSLWRDAPPASEGWYDDLSSRRDVPPASKGRYATPATTGRDDESIIKSPISESASTVRKIPVRRLLLGTQQIDSIMKSQYGRKIGKLPDSFITVLESEQEEMPTPILTLPSAKSNNSGSFELLPARWHTRTGAVAGSLESLASTPHATDSETPSSPQFQMAKIRVLAEDIHQQSGKDDDVLGALQLTFDKEWLKAIFPRRIESHPSNDGSGKDLFAFNQDYLSHLASVMTLSSNTLHEFLRAAEVNDLSLMALPNTTTDRHSMLALGVLGH
jgi:hypothetical protein